MLRRFVVIGCVLALSALGALQANATVVNIDFNGFGVGQSVGQTAVGPGPFGDGTVWNGITADSSGGNYYLSLNQSNLLDSYGSATTIGFSVSNVGADHQTGDALMEDYLFCNDNYPGGYSNTGVNPAFTISGLGNAATADICFYSAFDGGFSIDGGSGTKSTWAQGVKFEGVQVVNGTISGHLADNYQAAYPACLSVIYGLCVSTHDVPEPGTIIMVVVGTLGMLAYAWRKRK